ncbi:MAG: chemotaxis protein CheD [Fimbriimonadaceae bacterium]|nr:chemotaxis protein CheD [Fimbriimonadaceae bacterium]
MKTIQVGLAECRASDSPHDQLMAIGLGSCVAVAVYDPSTGVGGLAHVMLPAGQASDDKPAKFATSAIPALLAQVGELGADPAELLCGIFGGATLLSTGQSTLLQIGDRNVTAVVAALEKAGLSPLIREVGGTKGRTIGLAVGSGEVTIKILGQEDRRLGELTTRPEVSR